jgi:phosphoribosylformimino-5-aminoimidazole carboxamide ribotide isomerase
LVLALDVRYQAGTWRLPVHGWTEDSLVTLENLAAHYQRAGAKHVLCTDIERDGMLSGFNLDLYRVLRALAPDFEIQASGGACALDDIRQVRDSGVRSVIVGRALLEGKFALQDALRC